MLLVEQVISVVILGDWISGIYNELLVQQFANECYGSEDSKYLHF